MTRSIFPARRSIYIALLLLISALITLVAVLTPLMQSALALIPRAGEIARRDYRSPVSLSFTSDVLTQQRRETAERAVSPIYSSPDTRVARRQLEQLRSALAFINNVRMDSYATIDQQLSDLSALDDINLKGETAQAILSMPDARWQEIQQEAIAVLERVMSSAIRPETLSDARSRVPVLVTLSLPEEQAAIVAELATGYVSPNSEYSENLTMAARSNARQEVSPVIRTFVPGQTIVLQGEMLGAEDLEALQHLGLTNPVQSIQDIASGVLFCLLMVLFMALYIRRKQIWLHTEVRNLVVLVSLQLGFLLSARLIIPTNNFLAYAFPLASAALVTAALFGTELALVSAVPLSLLAAFGLPNAMELTIYYLVSSMFGVLVLGRARRLITFLWAGLVVAISGTAVITVFQLPLPSSNMQTLGTFALAAFSNGLIAASFSILLHSLLAPFLGMLTPLQLFDLTRPDHPLLGLMLREAPGTYQHSLQVANLAEQAAEGIGVDPLLIRAGALYHDVGKAANPAFFIENQPPGFENPHEKLEPLDSSRVIIAHVTEGLKLARRNRLPRRIWDFIAEHHGTTITNYQYFNAVKAAGGDESLVDKSLFRYPGPRPQTRETAILMLADACEARVRAERPAEVDALRSLIKNIVSSRVSSGQLDDTRLTLHDLDEIVDSFTATLRGIYHPRIHYPNQESPSIPESAHQAITIPISKKTDKPVDVNAR